ETTAGMRSAVRALLLAKSLKNEKDFQSAQAEFVASAETLDKALKEIRPIMNDEADKRAVANLESDLTTWQGYFREIVRLCVADQFAAANELRTGKTREVAKAMGKYADDILTLQNNNLAAAAQKGADLSSRTMWVVAGCIGIAVL